MRCTLLIRLLPIGIVALAGCRSPDPPQRSRIDLYDRDSWEEPVLIAHRGGVVTPEASENSLEALELAAEMGYAMVEVDVRESRDRVPIAFHDSTMLEETGVDSRIEDLTADEVRSARYRATGTPVLTLEQYLDRAGELGLGIMLDVKTNGTDQFFESISSLLEEHDLSRATVTISSHSGVARRLIGHTLEPVTAEEVAAVEADSSVALAGKFWFGWPRYISNEMVGKLRERGALVIPSINVFHYDDEDHLVAAERDIRRMHAAGVDAYQIDGVYTDLVRRAAEGPVR